MKVAIMQPYFLPYIGYFQLINAVDKFIVYDNIEFTKKGWINRNRILVNGKDEYITLPLKKDSDYLHINQRYLADTFQEDKQKIIRKIMEAYRKAPMFENTFALIQKIFAVEHQNLFQFIFNSIEMIGQYLEIETELAVSSSYNIDHQLKAEQKVIALCKAANANTYINPIGGTELYQRATFAENQLEIAFLQANNITYPQFTNEFVPWLSMLDVMMFNSTEKISELLDNNYKLI